MVYFPFHNVEGSCQVSEYYLPDGSGVYVKRCCTLAGILETTYSCCQLRSTVAQSVWIFI